MTKIALVIGATGLIGRHLTEQLADSGHYSRVIALVRRETAWSHSNIENIVLPDFAQLASRVQLLDLQHADAFSALGSTIKQAGSQARFRQIDYGYNLAFAQACHQAGAQHFLLVSALGADEGAMGFYNRVKGELERDIRALNFDQLSIFQPSLLLGEHSDPRLAEKIAQSALGWMKGVIPRAVRPIEGERVAAAMQRVASLAPIALAKPVQVYSNADMFKLTTE